MKIQIENKGNILFNTEGDISLKFIYDDPDLLEYVINENAILRCLNKDNEDIILKIFENNIISLTYNNDTFFINYDEFYKIEALIKYIKYDEEPNINIPINIEHIKYEFLIGNDILGKEFLEKEKHKRKEKEIIEKENIRLSNKKEIVNNNILLLMNIKEQLIKFGLNDINLYIPETETKLFNMKELNLYKKDGFSKEDIIILDKILFRGFVSGYNEHDFPEIIREYTKYINKKNININLEYSSYYKREEEYVAYILYKKEGGIPQYGQYIYNCDDKVGALESLLDDYGVFGNDNRDYISGDTNGDYTDTVKYTPEYYKNITERELKIDSLIKEIENKYSKNSDLLLIALEIHGEYQQVLCGYGINNKKLFSEKWQLNDNNQIINFI